MLETARTCEQFNSLISETFALNLALTSCFS